MIILYIILGLIALLLIIGLFVSKDLNYEKSVSVNAPIAKVWKNVSSHTAMDQWNPWKDKDPNMERNLTGTDGTVGATQHWISNEKKVGEGKQTISNLVEPTLYETKLEFIKPFKSLADGYVKLQEDNGQTAVTWGFKSKMPYPMNLMKLFMNFEKSMEADFSAGLGRLKALCEK